jgi:hypothetical protein
MFFLKRPNDFLWLLFIETKINKIELKKKKICKTTMLKSLAAKTLIKINSIR